MGRNRHTQLVWVPSALAGRPINGYGSLREAERAADETQHHREAEPAGSLRAFPRAANPYPDRKRFLAGARSNRRIAQRSTEAPRPRHVIALSQGKEEVELFAENRVVVIERHPEDGERFDECAAAYDDLRTAVADEVQGGEILIDPNRVEHAQDGYRAGQSDRSCTRRDRRQHDGRRRDSEVQGVMFAEREQIQVQPLSDRGEAKDLVDPLFG